jgi:hypothetical protein
VLASIWIPDTCCYIRNGFETGDDVDGEVSRIAVGIQSRAEGEILHVSWIEELHEYIKKQSRADISSRNDKQTLARAQGIVCMHGIACICNAYANVD